MKTLSDVMWQAMEKTYRGCVDKVCKDYEEKKEYTVKKIVENGELVGFFVWFDKGENRMVEGAYYLGSNKYVLLKMYREMMNGAKNLVCTVQKSNKRMYEALTGHGFIVTGDDYSNFYLKKAVK